MAKLPTIDVKNLPEVVQRITQLENALHEIKKLMQQVRYYEDRSAISKALAIIDNTLKNDL